MQDSSARQTLAQRIFAVLMVMVLAVGLMPSMAFGAEDIASDDNTAGTVTFTVVKGVSEWTGVNTLVNKSYKFEEGATLGDLFAAAKEAGDIKDYKFADSGYGSYLSSITLADGTELANASDLSTYWANYKNGDYAQGETDCTEGDLLKDGDAFGFAWETYPSLVGPSTDQWNTLAHNSKQSTGMIGKGGSGSVTFTLVRGVSSYTGPNAVVNLYYNFETDSGKTLGDLFEAAKNAKDISDYSFKDTGMGEYLYSVTLADGTVLTNASDNSTYWANYKNGTYASGATDCTKSDVIKDGDAFGFAWETYPSLIGPSKDQWNSVAKSAVASDQIVKHEQQTTPDDPTKEEDNNKKTSDKTATKSTLAKTADSNVALFAGMFAMASVAVAGIAIARRRRA